jgi:hypothetical protein
VSYAPPSEQSDVPRTRRPPRISRRAGRVLVALGSVLVLAAVALFALIMNWLPLEHLVPSTLRVTGPVRASTAVFVWDAIYYALGAILLGVGIRRLRRAELPHSRAGDVA